MADSPIVVNSQTSLQVARWEIGYTDGDVPGLDQFLAGICALTGVLFPPFEETI
jgi:hypothetical protein